MSFARLAIPLLFTTLMVTTAIVGAHASDVPGTGHITAVTVYQDRATVTRTMSIPVTSGDHVAVITDLPGGLAPESLRAEGKSSASVILGAVESKMINAAEVVAPRERELQTKLQDLQDARALLAADQTALNARINFINKIGDTAAGRVNDDIKNTVTLKPEEWGAAAIKISSTIADTQKALQLNTVALRKQDADIAAVQADLNQIQNGSRQSYTVRVPYTANGDGTLTLNLQYQIYGATWQPIYDARLSTDTKSLDLLQYGQVSQNTGEDWSDALLTLSTAQPSRGAVPPPLYTQWLNIFEPQAYLDKSTNAASLGGAMVKARRADIGFADGAVAPAPMTPAMAEKAATFQTAQINAGGYVAEYRIPGTTTVLSDGSSKKVMIQKLKTTTSLLAQARPALDPNVYLIAKIKLGGDAPLLPGQVNLFRDNAFIGTESQAMLRPGEDTNLPFGIDDQVVMKRKTLVDKRGTTGVISTQSTLDRQYDTEIQNLHTFDIALDMLESLPVAQDERIKVAVNEGATTPGFKDNAHDITGLKQWSFAKLAPQAKQSVKFGYNVTWPKDAQVNGL